MKRYSILLSIVALVAIIGGYAIGESASKGAKSDLVSKADTTKEQTKEITKPIYKNPQIESQSSTNLTGPEQQVYALNHLKLNKLDYQNFQQFLTGTLEYWEPTDLSLVSAVVYPKYFAEHTNNKSMKEDMLDVKKQAEKAILNNKRSKDIQELKHLIERLNKKYN